MDHQFRNAALGGFNKQDVLDYLELVSKEHEQQLQALQEQLQQAKDQCGQLSAEAAQHDTQLEQLRQTNQQLLQKSAQFQEELRGCQDEKRQLQDQLDQARAEQKALQAQVDKLTPDAEAYAAVKERAAGVELDAHRRAQGVLDQAEDQAKQLHSQMEQWLSRVGREYADLRSQVDATVSHAAGELEKAGSILAQVTQELAQQDDALDELRQAFSQRGPVKVPAPMPIPED
jgi:chromosome segregation ATPase